jgi:NAD(P)-dependent dehydrogenase (short-subunit alcohol dehydrogenase family)
VDLGLDGKVAVVTGSRTGIGLAVCRVLAAEGMRVVGDSRGPVEHSIEGVEHLRSDLTEPGAVEGLVQHAVEHYGSLSVLVNNAGTGTIRSGSVSAPDDEWASLLGLNLQVAVRATRDSPRPEGGPGRGRRRGGVPRFTAGVLRDRGRRAGRRRLVADHLSG